MNRKDLRTEPVVALTGDYEIPLASLGVAGVGSKRLAGVFSVDSDSGWSFNFVVRVRRGEGLASEPDRTFSMLSHAIRAYDETI